MGNEREYVVLRAIRSIRQRDPFSGLSGIRFRESMIVGAAPRSQSTTDEEDLSRRDVDAIDARGIGEVGAIDAPFDGGDADVAVLDADIERAHVDGSQIGVARGGRCAPIGKVLSDDSGGSSDSLFRAMKRRLERAGVNTLSAREGGGL